MTSLTGGLDLTEQIPAWVRSRFGEDAGRIQGALWDALKETERATLEAQGAVAYPQQFTAGGARMTTQFGAFVDCLIGLGIEGTEVVKTGNWHSLALVRDTIFYPVHANVQGDEPDTHWPKRRLSGLVQELFAVTDSKAPQWVADTLDGYEALPPELRPSLAELATRDPRPGLVLVVFEMDRSGLKRVWWGQANLLDPSGNLSWITERSMLRGPLSTPMFPLNSTLEDDRFDSGDLPEVPMAGRSEADRRLGIPPTTEKADETEGDAAESDEN